MADEHAGWPAGPVQAAAAGSAAPDSAAAPDGDGFEAFVRARQPMLTAYLCRRMPAADAQDVAQECMIRLLRYRGLPEAQLRPLMYRIALNVVHDRGRRDLSHRRQDHVALDEQGPALVSDEPTQEERAVHRQQLDHVRKAIRALPPRCREVYLLNRITGMSYSQIARHRGITAKTVEKHVARALQGLRRELGADAFGMGGDE